MHTERCCCVPTLCDVLMRGFKKLCNLFYVRRLRRRQRQRRSAPLVADMNLYTLLIPAYASLIANIVDVAVVVAVGRRRLHLAD